MFRTRGHGPTGKVRRATSIRTASMTATLAAAALSRHLTLSTEATSSLTMSLGRERRCPGFRRLSDAGVYAMSFAHSLFVYRTVLSADSVWRLRAFQPEF